MAGRGERSTKRARGAGGVDARGSSVRIFQGDEEAVVEEFCKRLQAYSRTAGALLTLVRQVRGESVL